MYTVKILDVENRGLKLFIGKGNFLKIIAHGQGCKEKMLLKQNVLIFFKYQRHNKIISFSNYPIKSKVD